MKVQIVSWNIQSMDISIRHLPFFPPIYVVLYEIYSVKSRVTNTYVHWMHTVPKLISYKVLTSWLLTCSVDLSVTKYSQTPDFHFTLFEQDIIQIEQAPKFLNIRRKFLHSDALNWRLIHTQNCVVKMMFFSLFSGEK